MRIWTETWKSNFVINPSANENTMYLCQSGYGGNEYSKSAVFEAYEGDNIDDLEDD